MEAAAKSNLKKVRTSRILWMSYIRSADGRFDLRDIPTMLGQVSLELGGKSAHIIFESADLNQGARIITALRPSFTSLTSASLSRHHVEYSSCCLGCSWFLIQYWSRLHGRNKTVRSGNHLRQVHRGVQNVSYMQSRGLSALFRFAQLLVQKGKNTVVADGFHEKAGAGPLVCILSTSTFECARAGPVHVSTPSLRLSHFIVCSVLLPSQSFLENHWATISCPRAFACALEIERRNATRSELMLISFTQVSKQQYEKVWSYIEAGKQAGAKLVLGGQKLPGKGYFISPTSQCRHPHPLTIV